MLRALVIGLILLNALFYGWTQGWLDEVVGIKAQGDREPERLARQIHPEQVVVLPAELPASAPSASASASATATATATATASADAAPALACLSLGPLDGDAALASATQALTQAGIADSQWRDLVSEQAGVMQTSWAVATIRMPNKEFQARKEATYKSMKIDFEHLSSPANELPTLVLSRHPSEKAATAALEALSRRALKGLRVLALQTPAQRHRLVFTEADAALQAKLNGLALAPGFKPCAMATAQPPASASAAASASPAMPAKHSPTPAASASPR